MSESDNLLKAIIKAIHDNPKDPGAYAEYLTVSEAYNDRRYNEWIRQMCSYSMKNADDEDELRLFREISLQTLLMDARVSFHHYLLYVEHKKPYGKQFYAPRMRYLKRVADAYQKVEDGKTDLLVIEMCKRAGKSQCGINFVNWISGKRPDRSTLMEGSGDALVDSFYKGCLEYMQDPDYAYFDVFPNSPLVQTNADTKIWNQVSKNRFPTGMCRSIDARQIGLSEATNLLYLDDCVEGREEAMNRSRLDLKWEVISGDVLGRVIEGTPIVICGTRYSIYDPISHLIDEGHRLGWRVDELRIPALDPITDESNYEFELRGKKIFTTRFFRNQREMLSPEQWMSEFQQEPFESKGMTLPESELNYYFEEPVDVEADYIMGVCDTAEGKGDSTAMPIAKIYGNDVYIVDVVFDNAPPDVTKAECVAAIINNKAGQVTFESNLAGTYYARDVENMLTDNNYKCSIRTKRTISNKLTRIELASDTIKKHFYFKHPSTVKPGTQYALFMKEATSHTRTGKVPHDDAIDSLSLLENEIRTGLGAKIEVRDRFF